MQRTLSPTATDPLMGSQRGFSSPPLRTNSYPVPIQSVPLLGSMKNVLRSPSPPATTVRTLATPGRSPSGSLAAPIHPMINSGSYVSVAPQASLSGTLQALKAANSPGSSVASSVQAPAVSTPGRPSVDSNGLTVRQATKDAANNLSRQSTVSKAGSASIGSASIGSASIGSASIYNPKAKPVVKAYPPGSPNLQYRPGMTTLRTAAEDRKQARTLRVAYAPSRTQAPLTGSYAKAKTMPARQVGKYAAPKKAVVAQKPLAVEKVDAAEVSFNAYYPPAKGEELIPPPAVMTLPEAGLASNGCTVVTEVGTIELGKPSLFFIDNTHACARSNGLSLRVSKNLEDKHAKLIPWDHAVHGIDEGDGWLNVNGMYLPFAINGKPVIAKEQYVVCNRELGHSTHGLAFRHSQDHSDKDEEHIALWGTRITGMPEGQWFRVGNKYLPMTLNGVPTIRLAEVKMAPAFEELPEVKKAPARTSCFAGCGNICSPSAKVKPVTPKNA